MLTAEDIARFKRDGFLLLKGVLTPDEVARYRSVEFEGETADLAALPDLANLWADHRLLEIARRLLGEQVAFFGEASYRRDVFNTDALWGGRLHHDAKGTVEHLFNRQHQPTPEPYPILRCSFYLQDHAHRSGGLKVVPGSHQVDSSDFDLAKLTYLDVPSEPGDAVVFCNKILHAAHAMRPKAGPSLSPAEQGRRYDMDPQAFWERPRDRRVFFIDYAAHTELADIYIKSRALNPSSLKQGFADLAISGVLAQAADKAGITIRLDAAVVEAVTKIFGAVSDGVVGEAGYKYLLALPALCRLSKSWSPHFDFVPVPPDADTIDAGLQLAMALAPRIKALRQQLQTVRPDTAMAARAVVRKTSR
jgi:hypothetical protein